MTISIQQAQIATLYVGCFNGPADPAGQAYWGAFLPVIGKNRAVAADVEAMPWR